MEGRVSKSGESDAFPRPAAQGDFGQTFDCCTADFHKVRSFSPPVAQCQPYSIRSHYNFHAILTAGGLLRLRQGTHTARRPVHRLFRRLARGAALRRHHQRRRRWRVQHALRRGGRPPLRHRGQYQRRLVRFFPPPPAQRRPYSIAVRAQPSYDSHSWASFAAEARSIARLAIAEVEVMGVPNNWTSYTKTTETREKTVVETNEDGLETSSVVQVRKKENTPSAPARRPRHVLKKEYTLSFSILFLVVCMALCGTIRRANLLARCSTSWMSTRTRPSTATTGSASLSRRAAPAFDDDRMRS